MTCHPRPQPGHSPEPSCQKAGATSAGVVKAGAFRAGVVRPGIAWATTTVAGLTLATAAQAQTSLYLPQSGLPATQGWATLLQGTAGSTTLGADSLQLDTSADPATRHGFARLSPLALDTAGGFALSFTLRVDAQASSSANRAGFSLVLVGQDPSHALELAFGTTEVFQYNYVAADPDRFVRGSAASFASGTAHQYLLQVASQQYTLSIDGVGALSGSLVDYRADGLPYTTPNFLFFGDDTSRASSSVAIGPIVLNPVPEPASAALLLAGLAGLAAWARRRGPNRPRP